MGMGQTGRRSGARDRVTSRSAPDANKRNTRTQLHLTHRTTPSTQEFHSLTHSLTHSCVSVKHRGTRQTQEPCVRAWRSLSVKNCCLTSSSNLRIRCPPLRGSSHVSLSCSFSRRISSSVSPSICCLHGGVPDRNSSKTTSLQFHIRSSL